MNVQTIPSGPLDANCYLALFPGCSEALVIDPAADPDTVFRQLPPGVSVGGVLVTHAHFDHVACLRDWKDLHVPVYAGALDAPGLSDPAYNLTALFAVPSGCTTFPEADVLLSEGDLVPPGGGQLRVLHTPGHSAGSLCFFAPGVLFAGDTIFADGGVGRTDFPGGDLHALACSVARLMTLPPTTVVYPGHGRATTIANEIPFHQHRRTI